MSDHLNGLEWSGGSVNVSYLRPMVILLGLTDALFCSFAYKKTHVSAKERSGNNEGRENAGGERCTWHTPFNVGYYYVKS